jgi:hypothetical protein
MPKRSRDENFNNQDANRNNGEPRKMPKLVDEGSWEAIETASPDASDSDIRVKCGVFSWQCHSDILSSRCSFFKACLCSGFKVLYCSFFTLH